MAFSPDSKLFAFGGYSQFAELCEAKTGNVRYQLEGYVTAMVFAPDSKTLATARQQIALYDVSSGQAEVGFPAAG